MKTLTLLILLVASSVLFYSCSTAKVRVLPGDNGVHKVVARDIEKEGAEEAANEAARDYCKGRKQEAVFLSDESNYTGKMDEETRKTVRKASQAAVILGGVNSPVSTAGSAGGMMTSDRDYEAKATFKCK